MRDWIFTGLLTLAAALITAGVYQWSTGVALITAGVLLVVLAFVVFVVGEAGYRITNPADDLDADEVPNYPTPAGDS